MELLIIVLMLVLLVGTLASGYLSYSALRKAEEARQAVAELEPEVDKTPPNPGGCTKTDHVWRNRPTLISGSEEVYYCKKNCGSSLRHRMK